MNVREIKLEIELPGAEAWWCLALLIKKGESQLDDLQEVNITTQQLVLVVCIASELTYWPRNHSRELCVLECAILLGNFP